MSSEPIRVLLVEDNLGDARLLYEDLEEALPGQFQMAHVRQLSYNTVELRAGTQHR